MTCPGFKVIIVGGGVAGLTLANALTRADIDYLLLEGRDQIAPSVGASIAIAGNGARILDQLGLFDEIEEHTVSFEIIKTWKDGRLIAWTDGVHLNHVRSGYPFSFMDRHFLLQTLFDRIPDKSKVLLGKRVSRVDHSPEGVSVQCKDGTTYTGHVVVAADGVHSIVRREMWRHMTVEDPHSLKKKEQTLMYSEYRCMYGVSEPHKELSTGSLDRVLGKDLSFMHTVDKSGRVFWFVFEKMNKRYHVPEVPKFTHEEGESLGKKLLNMQMTDKVTFEELWHTRKMHALVPMEEAWYDKWTWGRFACVGDSIHKWTPNIGQGGNNAIESAAAMANALHKLATSKQDRKLPSHEAIHDGLEMYHKHRKARAKAYFMGSIMTTRQEALANPTSSFMMLHIFPYVGDFFANLMTDGVIGAEKLNYLPDPERSFLGTTGFNPNYGVGNPPSKLKRALVALPLLSLAYVCRIMFGTIISSPALNTQLENALKTSQIDFGTEGKWQLPRLPMPLPILNAVFAPSLLNIDPAQRLQALTFLLDYAVLYLVWVFESHRRGSVIKLASFTIFFGLAAQLYGGGIVAPVLFFLHYIQNPIKDYTVLDWRLINVAAARTALPAMLCSFTIPLFAMYFLPSLSMRLPANVVWQIFPILLPITHYFFSKAFITDTWRDDRMYNIHRDLPFLRIGLSTLAAISTAGFTFVRFTTPVPFTTIFFPPWTTATFLLSSSPAHLDVVSGMRLFMQLDQLSIFTSAFLWLALLINDMKRAEMTHTSWVKLLSCAIIGICAVGPGATIALGWVWREQILATRRAKGAVVKGGDNRVRFDSEAVRKRFVVETK